MVNTKALKMRMLDHGVTVNELADMVGIRPAYMSSLINGKRPLTLKVANSIQKALEIHNTDFGFYFLDGAE